MLCRFNEDLLYLDGMKLADAHSEELERVVYWDLALIMFLLNKKVFF